MAAAAVAPSLGSFVRRDVKGAACVVSADQTLVDALA